MASFVFQRDLRRPPRRVVSGRGSYLVDEDGRRYLDAVGGAMVVNAGHGIAELAERVAQQIRAVAYVNGTQFTSAPAEELAAELAGVLPEPLKYSYFLCGGSEAVEAAIKLARQVQVERGRPSKWKVIGRRPAYHGSTLAALSLTSRSHYRDLYGPLLTPFPLIPAPDRYRHPGCAACTGDALEAEILAQGSDTVAAFLLEPIVASSAGAMVPEPGYLERVRAICTRHDVLLIADEIACGMGRTGRWFAFEHSGAVPDVLVLGKGLAGGLAPLSALVARREIVELLARTRGAFVHAQTFSHSPVLCAAGLANVRYLKEHGLVERCARMERPFLARLERLRASALVGDVRGKGLLAGVELVANRETKAPFPRAERVAERLAQRAFENGLIVWPNAGHADGVDGDLVVLAPPFTVTEDELEQIAAILLDSLGEIA